MTGPGRAAVLQAYRRFEPVEVDTSTLDAPGVLDAVLVVLAARHREWDGLRVPKKQ